MSKGKYSRKAGFNVRPLVLMLAVALLIGATIGGTIAWLTAQTPDVTNTFTVGDVNITLKETEIIWANDETFQYGEFKENVQNMFKLIPGNTYKKNPTVEVIAGSEDCWLFVKFVEGTAKNEYVKYTSALTVDKGWTQGDGEKIPSNVWYREVKHTDEARKWELLEGNSITVDANKVTKESMADAKNGTSLVYTAYAVQTANLTVDQAWAEVAPKTT